MYTHAGKHDFSCLMEKLMDLIRILSVAVNISWPDLYGVLKIDGSVTCETPG